MKIKYSRDADILMIELREGTPADSIDIKEGIIVHLDNEGVPLEIELSDASRMTVVDEISVLTAVGQ
jgi:uncharacterized protein YuzE